MPEELGTISHGVTMSGGLQSDVRPRTLEPDLMKAKLSEQTRRSNPKVLRQAGVSVEQFIDAL